MQRTLFFFLLLFHLVTLSQEPLEEIYGYVKVFSVDGESKDDIHSIVLDWIG